MIIHLTVGLIRKTLYKSESILQNTPSPFRSFGGYINDKVDLSNYATKTDLKNVTQIDTSRFTLKTNLASLKTEVDKLDINKLAPVPFE